MPSERKMEAVLFDLDGTLVFHDQAQFLSEYFKSISSDVASLGYDPKEFLGAMDYATRVMLVNDGARLNQDLFWIKFFEYTSKFDNKIIEASDNFYIGKFKELRAFAQENSLAKKAVELAHEKGRKVVLATNPVFPMTAQLERLSWSGLSEKDFDLITSYENSHYCKPDPRYYFEICKKIDVNPQNAIMIGNDEREDMKGAFEAGLMGYLVTDCRIMAKDYYWKGQRGSFEQSLKILALI